MRGRAGENLTTASVRTVGAEFVEVLGIKGQTVLVGGDRRPASSGGHRHLQGSRQPRGQCAATESLNSPNERHFAADAIFMASHTPTEYNGMKMTRAGAAPVPSETDMIEIRDLAQQ